MREMNEEQLRDQVVAPLLRKLGRQGVRYNHHPNERGKDFISIKSDDLAGDQLYVTQVKNAKITGSSTSPDGLSGILRQINAAISTLSLNPLTNTMEVPHRVEFISTYPIEDHVAGNYGQELARLRAMVDFVTPERFASLVDKHIPQAVKSAGSGEHSIWNRLLHSIDLNADSIAFSGEQTDLVSAMFIETNCELFEKSKPKDPDELSSGFENSTFFNGVVRGANELWQKLAGCDFFVQASTSSVPASRRKSTTGTASEEKARTKPSQKKIHFDLKNGLCVPVEMNPLDLFDLIKVFVDLVREDIDPRLSTFVHDRLVKALKQRKKSLEVDMKDLLGSSVDLAVIGPAGFGKTFLTKMLAMRAIRADAKCVLLPCKHIEESRKDISSSLVDFVSSVTRFEEEHVEHICDDLDVLALDGCDEAPTFPEKLGEQIRNSTGHGAVIEVAVDEDCEFCIPESLKGRIQVYRRKKANWLQCKGRLSPFEVVLLMTANATEGGASKEFLSVQQLCERIKSRSPRRLVISSRKTFGMGDFDGMVTLHIRPLSDTQVTQFFKKRLGTGRDLQRVLDSLAASISVKEACRSPLMASVVAGLAKSRIPLPNSRQEIYEKRFDLLMGVWDSTRGVNRPRVVGSGDKWKFIQEIAFRMHKDRVQHVNLPTIGKVWSGGFERINAGVTAIDVVKELVDKDCILFEVQDGEFTFGHLSYQEFLCARHLVFAHKHSTLARNIALPWWQNVALFYASIASSIEPVLREVQRLGKLSGEFDILRDMLDASRSTPSSIRGLFLDLIGKPRVRRNRTQ